MTLKINKTSVTPRWRCSEYLLADCVLDWRKCEGGVAVLRGDRGRWAGLMQEEAVAVAQGNCSKWTSVKTRQFRHSRPLTRTSLPPVTLPCRFTFSVHFLIRAASSVRTRSTHFRHGSFSLTICFFTMASNARSGVNRPVLQ